MGQKKTFHQKNIKILWGRAHNRCSICKAILIEENADGSPCLIGKNAQIEGEKPGSARYKPKYNYLEKATYHNLI